MFRYNPSQPNPFPFPSFPFPSHPIPFIDFFLFSYLSLFPPTNNPTVPKTSLTENVFTFPNPIIDTNHRARQHYSQQNSNKKTLNNKPTNKSIDTHPSQKKEIGRGG